MRTGFDEIIRFGIAGGVCFFLDFALLFALTEYGGVSYLYSAGIAFTVSVLINYALCVVYVFDGARAQSAMRATAFFGSSLAGLALNQFCMWLSVDVAGLHYLAAKVVSAAVVMLFNYVAKRRIVRG